MDDQNDLKPEVLSASGEQDQATAPKQETIKAENSQPADQSPGLAATPQNPKTTQDSDSKPETPTTEGDTPPLKPNSAIKEDRPKKNKRLFIILAGVILVLASLLVGNYFYQKKLNKDMAAKRETSTYLNHLAIAYPSGPQGFYPEAPNDFTTQNYSAHYYEGLTAFNKNMEIQPQLAQSWENPSQNTWRFRLRKDVTFHNGQKMTADDVVASYNLALLYEDQNPLIPTVESVKKVDNYTVDIITNTPNKILANTITSVFILPSSLINSKDWIHPIGTGPYKFVSDQDSTVNLTRYDNYYGNKTKVKDVTLMAIADDNERLTALKKGEVDIVKEVTPTADGTKANDGKAIKFAVSAPIDANFLFFDSTRNVSPQITGVTTNPLKDVRVRTAMALALDVPAIINSGDFNNKDPQATQMVPPSIFGYNPNIKPLKQDITRARALMKEAGYEKGFTITYDTVGQQLQFQRLLKEQFAQIGITFKVHYYDPESNDYYDKIAKGDTAMATLSDPATSGDALMVFEDMLAPGGSGNFFSIDDPEINALITRTKSASDLSKRKEYLQQLATVVDQKKYIIPLLSEVVVYDYRDGLVVEPRADGFSFAYEISSVVNPSLKNYTYLDSVNKILHIKI